MYRAARLLIATALIVSTVSPGICSQTDSKRTEPTGRIGGRVVDGSTQSPVIGASVLIAGTERGSATDDDGKFTIKNIPVGSYVVAIRAVGYEPLSKTDIIVRPGRITHITSELSVSAVELSDIVVSAGYFAQEDSKPTSSTTFSGEEIRRAPGSAGDVSRIIHALPSIAKVDDQINSLVVRGGSPSENAFYLDNIEIPNINHYPLQGTTGGPISLINVDFLDKVEFSAGGFPSKYGDRLSSVMELTFREGNREEFDGQIDFNMAGVGAVLEGPLAGGRGSWMFSGRRSYLDLLVDAVGVGVAPRYSDYQGKIVYDLSSRSKLSILGIAGVDYFSLDSSTAWDDCNQFYGDFSGYEHAFGANWRYLWGGNGYSNTSVSYNAIKYKGDVQETKNGRHLFDQNSIESGINIRNINHFLAGDKHQLEFGFDAKYLMTDHDYHLYDYVNSFGDTIPALILDKYTAAPLVGAFVSHIWQWHPQITTTIGLRYDWLEYNGHAHLSPRFSFNYRFNPRTSLSGAAGIYRQFLPLSLMTQRDHFVDLADPVAYHGILGVSHLLSDDTRLTIETYYKEYDNFPMDPAQPQMFLADELGFARMVGNFETLKAEGKAWAAGLEAIIQKKLVAGVYGLLAGSYSRTRYRGLDGMWRDRLFDNKVNFSVEGGYKPNNKWEFGLRWICAGGRPQTPLDLDRSRLQNVSVRDASRVNEDRIPAYHSLNLRMDRRYHFEKSSLIVFLSIWNAYNRKNVSMYYWNEVERKEDVLYQWSMLPVIGLEYEF